MVVRDAAFLQATLAVAAHDHVVHVTEDVVKSASNNKDGRCYGNGPDTNLKWHWVKMRITLGEPQLGPHHVQRKWTVVTHDCPTHPFESPTNSGLVYPTYPSVAASDTKRGK